MSNQTPKTESKTNLKALNYLKLQYLLNNNALETLRLIFLHNWKVYTQVDWENGSVCGKSFVEGVASSLHKKMQWQTIQKKQLEFGDISQWDLALVMEAIQTFDNFIPPSKDYKQIPRSLRNKSFLYLKEVRNKLAHVGSTDISDAEFEQMFSKIADALIDLKVSQEELKVAKETSLANLSANPEDILVSKENTIKAKTLKDEGNLFYKNSNFLQAIQKYTEGIGLPDIPKKDLAILYSNRSASFLKLDDEEKYEQAKEDAQGAIMLQPKWSQGYICLGSAYKELKVYENALKNFNIALSLDESILTKELKEDIDYCKHMESRMNRMEHLDPMSQEGTMDYEEQAEKMGIPLSQLKLGASLAIASKTPYGMCSKAHQFLHGIGGIKQDSEQAAKYFTKAADLGSAEGLYNMACLLMDGKGVKRDIQQALALARKAASQKPWTKVDTQGKYKVPNLGVTESEHFLGMKYADGIGVEKNIPIALEWYHKAIKHGSTASANNCGIIHLQGDGVPQNPLLAEAYYKIAASWGLVRAMENLGDYYLNIRMDLKSSRKWYAYAYRKGSIVVRNNLEEFRQLLGDLENYPLEMDAFELELEDEVKHGPLKYLISDEENVYKFYKNAKDLVMPKESAPVRTLRAEYGLEDTGRVFMLKHHRERILEMKKGFPEYSKGVGKLAPKAVFDLFGLKQIFFSEMTTKEDKIYEGNVLKVTMIEDAITGLPSIQCIGEDKNGDAQRIHIYNFPQDKETQDKLGFGCQVSIVNPYFRFADDGRCTIRVDNQALIFLHETLKDKKRCRYCGKGNCTTACRKCFRSFYCSKQCMKKDAEELQHELVCKKKI